jgi:hypothetical protein
VRFTWNLLAASPIDHTAFHAELKKHFSLEVIDMSISEVLRGNVLNSNVSHTLSAVSSPATICDDSPIQLNVQFGSLTVTAKTIEEVIVSKRIELIRVGQELDALRIVTPLLQGEQDHVNEVIERTHTLTATPPPSPQGEADVDLHPAFFSWWQRWQEATTNRFLFMASIKRRS